MSHSIIQVFTIAKIQHKKVNKYSDFVAFLDVCLIFKGVLVLRNYVFLYSFVRIVLKKETLLIYG